MMYDTYTGPDRCKRNGSDPVTLDDLDEALETHAIKEREYVKQVMDSILKAFPNGDIEGHHAYHESKIRAARAEEEFWQTAKSEALKHGVAGLFVVGKWILILAAVGLAYKVGAGPAVAKVLGVS